MTEEDPRDLEIVGILIEHGLLDVNTSLTVHIMHSL
jgi:hypothetical protein